MLISSILCPLCYCVACCDTVCRTIVQGRICTKWTAQYSLLGGCFCWVFQFHYVYSMNTLENVIQLHFACTDIETRRPNVFTFKYLIRMLCSPESQGITTILDGSTPQN